MANQKLWQELFMSESGCCPMAFCFEHLVWLLNCLEHFLEMKRQDKNILINKFIYMKQGAIEPRFPSQTASAQLLFIQWSFQIRPNFYLDKKMVGDKLFGKNAGSALWGEEDLVLLACFGLHSIPIILHLGSCG